MKRRSLLWTVLPYYLAIIVLALALTAWYASDQMKRLYLDEIGLALQTRAQLVETQMRPLFADSDTVTMRTLSKRLGDLSNTRITIIDSTGLVRGDSKEDPAVMENHGQRPEIGQAFAGEVGISQRHSNTLQETMIYVAVPLRLEGRIVGVVRTAQPITAVHQALDKLHFQFLLGGLVIALLATLVSYFLFHRLNRPLHYLRLGAEKFSRGDLKVRLATPAIDEFAALAEAMNSMAGQLDQRMGIVAEQRNEREAILASMSDGLIALDADEKITRLNQAASKLLGLNPAQAVGQSIYEVVRSAVLHDLVRSAARSGEVTEADLMMGDPEESHLQAHCAALNNSEGERVGLVVILTDITRLMRLERVRRDFVANVSHELKTPITAISGSVEALADGAFEDETARDRFLEIVTRHSRRLGMLVDDLLSLARIEAEAERGDIELTPGSIVDVLETAVLICRSQAEKRNIAVDLECPTELSAFINKPQLEQAVTNLIDNGLKYSSGGGEMKIVARPEGDEIVISVTDQGDGIEPQHLSRLFERFYRVDTARSRETGGTGLGLAIVKHISLAHSGRVSVESVLGQGSTFSIHLPRRS